MVLLLNHASSLSQLCEGISKHVDDQSMQHTVIPQKKLPNTLEETKVIRNNVEGPFLH